MPRTPLEGKEGARQVQRATTRARKDAEEPVSYLREGYADGQYIEPPAGFTVQAADGHKLATRRTAQRADNPWKLDDLDRRARVKKRLDQGWSIAAICADLDISRKQVEGDAEWLAMAARTVLARSVESLRDQALTRHQEEIDAARADLADPTFPAGAKVSLRRLIRDLLNDRNAMLGLDKADPIREDLASRTAAMLARANEGDAQQGIPPLLMAATPEPDDPK